MATEQPKRQDEEEEEEERKPVRKVSVKKKSAQEDPERVLREKLVKLAEVTISTTEKYSELRGREPPSYLRSFETYLGLLKKAKTLDAFRRSIVATYTAHRSDVVRAEIDGLWLSEAKIPIKWVITPRETTKIKEYEAFYLDLSKGFRNAMYIADYAVENKGQPGIDPELPELYLFHLYQVFREVVDDKDDLQGIDDILEALKPKTTASSVLGSIDKNSVQSIVAMAMDVIKGFGVEVDNLNPEDVASKISNVAKNPALGQLMNSVGHDLKGCKSPKDVVDVLVKQAAPGTKSELREVMGQIKDEIKGPKPKAEDKPEDKSNGKS